jgi:hypothetical protein
MDYFVRIIFLDIDGVLNSMNGLIRRGGQGLIDIYPEHCDVLDWILSHDKEIRIVISSTWRLHYSLKEFQTLFGMYHRISKNIIGCTPRLPEERRGTEIQKWLHDNEDKYDITDFVILDDDSDMLHLKDSHLIQTNGDYGLTYVEAYDVLDRFKDKDYINRVVMYKNYDSTFKE